MYQHKGGITLRKLARHDLNRLLSLKQEWYGTHTTPILNQEDQERWFDSIGHDSLYMIAETDRSMVGIACYQRIDWTGRVLEISGSIFPEVRKPELVKPAFTAGLDFAFEVLNMQRVGAEVLRCNYPAQVLEIDILGFKIEGIKRQCVYKSGKYYDSVVLGMLREEWENHERVKAYNGTCNLDFDHRLAELSVNRFNRARQATLQSLGGMVGS